MPYPNEHAARIKPPELFESGQGNWGSKDIADGVRIIFGKLKSSGKWEPQVYRFDSSKFTAEEAKKWCKDHDVHYESFAEATGPKSQIYTIPIHGLIGPPDGSEDKEQHFQFSDLLLHINNAKASDTIELDINSRGGYVDEADKMINALRATKKNFISKNSGDVASAASKIFTLAPKGQRFFDPSKGAFLIHNPIGKIEGDSGDMAKAAKALDEIEREYAKWYSDATGSDVNVIKSFMAEDMPLTPDQIEQLGFATISRSFISAVAKFKLNNIEMDNKEVTEKLNAFEKMLKGIKDALNVKIKAIMVSDVDGKELEFPDVSDPKEIKVGAKVNEGGKPANGNYKMPSGETYVCENGSLKEIQPKADDNTQALKAENEKLKAEIESLKKEKTNMEAKVDSSLKAAMKFEEEFKNFKAQFSEGNPGNGKPPAGKSEKKVLMTKEEMQEQFGY